jgi:hypothetical protein
MIRDDATKGQKVYSFEILELVDDRAAPRLATFEILSLGQKQWRVARLDERGRHGYIEKGSFGYRPGVPAVATIPYEATPKAAIERYLTRMRDHKERLNDRLKHAQKFIELAMIEMENAP